MRYPHRVRIYTPGEQTMDEETGRYTPADPTVLYDGPADVQDGGVVVRRDPESGAPLEAADAELFLPRAFRAGELVRPEVNVTILWNPEDVDLEAWDWAAPQDGADVQGAEVSQVRRLDDAIFLTLHRAEGA